MLQHNVTRHTARHDVRHGAHAAHATMLAMHALCCGLPALAVMVAAAGVSTVTAAVPWLGVLHALLHGHELWLLAASAALVALGGVLELRARRGGRHLGFPWMFAVSATCFAGNLVIILVHRGL